MSKAFFVVFFLLFSVNSFGQLIFRGDTYTQNLTTLSLVTNRDAGTNAYKCTIYIPSLGSIDLHMFRYDGYWYQTEYPYGLSLGAPRVKYRTSAQVLSTEPPCSATWFLINQSWVINFTTHPALSVGSVPESLMITGTGCTNQVNTSVTILPNGIVVPVSTTSSINTIQNPAVGMIIYDLTVACLKIYNGSAWVCI
jgi:hypothetical protein